MFAASRAGLASFRLPQLCSRLPKVTAPARSIHIPRTTVHQHSSVINLLRKTRSATGFLSRYSTASLGQSTPFTTSKSFNTRFFSSNSSPVHPLPTLSRPVIGIWLLSCSTMVFAIVVVGGVTRLTESGLSITEWKPITGVLPPLTKAQWEVEFDKYKATPEFKLLHHNFTLDEFKQIFYMEWGHRVLGRLLGLAFVLPLGYFALRKTLTPGLTPRLFSYALLLGAQGAMGWYMVKSGLSEEFMTTPGSTPRVSQYRLASHLALAFILYAGLFTTGMNVIKDWKFANGIGSGKGVIGAREFYANPVFRRFKIASVALTGLVFITAFSGAFVAGLDAGLLYNEWPLMGGQRAPPVDELMDPRYAKKADKSDLTWRNMLENPVTVQFEHRTLAHLTYLSTTGLFAASFLPSLRKALPRPVQISVMAAYAMVNVQLALGISTLLFMVPTPLAAAHQAGSVLLLSAMMHILVTMRRPGSAARAWGKAGGATRNAATAETAAAKGGAGGNGVGGAAAELIRNAAKPALA